MNIAVCIKMVPVSNNVSVDPVTHALIRESSEGMVNPADLNALEEAVLLKEKTDGKVVVFTMGPPDAEKSLRTALSMGCDEACLVSDRAFAGADTIATAKVLAESIKQYGKFDIIFAGALSSDGATGQVGPMIAEFLGIPHVSEMQNVQNSSGESVEVSKKYHNMELVIKAKLPCLLTVNFGANTPRLTTLRSQRAAKSKPLVTYSNAELKMEPSEIGLSGSPTVVKDTFEPEKLKTAVFLSSNPAEAAKEMMDLIKKEKGNN